MKITEIRIKPATSTNSQDRLLGFASIVIDGAFAISDIKIISGPQKIFIAMPSRKATTHCPQCHVKNQLGANYCNDCGTKLPPVDWSDDSVPKYFDIAHPINAEARALIEAEVIAAYHAQATAAPVAAAPIPARTGRRFFAGAQ